jgi:hypothetical protein
MKIQALALAALLSTHALAAEVAFDFKDPKGVNNIVFKLDGPLESISGTTNASAEPLRLTQRIPKISKGRSSWTPRPSRFRIP